MKDTLLKLPVNEDEACFVKITFRSDSYANRLLNDQSFLRDYLEDLSNHKLRDDMMVISDLDVTKIEVKVKCPDQLSAEEFSNDLNSIEGDDQFEVAVDKLETSVHWRKVAQCIKTRYEHLLERHEKKINELVEKLCSKKKKKKFVPPGEYDQIKKTNETYKEKIEELKKQKAEFEKSFSLLEECIVHYERSYIKAEEEVLRLERFFHREQERLQASLPIYAHRSEIAEMVLKNQVVILVGETGSGKTTQIIQYLHDEWPHSDRIIVCTQPRKVAAVSIAMRVAEEMKTKIGELVGYQVGMNKKRSKSTRLLFMTDHMLLNECQRDKEFSEYSCIILDEAHERSIHTDLLLGFIKQTLFTRPDLKLIITSATINPDVFVTFFKAFNPPVLKVSGRVFPVETFYEPMESIDYVQNTCEKAASLHSLEPLPGDILAFLTSPAETELAVKKLANMGLKNVSILPLHGHLQMSQQREVLTPTKSHVRKIVFATNAAETSVTIPGICHVIDPGYVKEAIFDSVKNMTSLDITKTTQSSADQRKGRAGRTECGKCYRLYKEEEFQEMRVNSVPEILRVHLGQAMLKLMMLGVKDPEKFDFVEAPSPQSSQAATKLLKDIGAIDSKGITEMGRKLAVLNLEPRLAKFSLMCLEDGLGYEGIAICALSSSGNQIFYRGGSDEDKFQSDLRKTTFCDDYGDLITLLNVYKIWKNTPKNIQVKWCLNNSINSKRIRGADDVVNEIMQSFNQELGVYIESRFSDETDVIERLARNIFRCFSSNLSRYTGNRKSGFRIMNRPETMLQIHPSSSLHYLEQPPAWVIFHSLLTTNQQWMLNVTYIKDEWVREAMDRGELLFSQEDVDAVVLEVRQLPLIGDKVKEMLLKRDSPWHTSKIVAKMLLQDERIHAIIDSRSLPQLFLYASTFLFENSYKIALDEIKLLKDYVSKEVLVKPIMPSSQVRFVMVQGARIAALLTHADFLEVDISSDKISVGHVEMLQQEGKLEFAKFFESESRWILTFNDSFHAQNFLKSHEGMAINEYGKVPEAKCGSFRVNVNTIRRPVKKTSFVEFKSESDRCKLLTFRTHISLGFVKLPIKPDRNSDLKIVIFSTPSWATQEMILEEISAYVPRERIAYVRLTRSPPPNKVEDKNQIEMLRHCINKYLDSNSLPFTLSISEPREKDFNFNATLTFISAQDAMVAIRRLKIHNLTATLDLKMTFHTPSKAYSKIENVLDEWLSQENSKKPIHVILKKSLKHNVMTVIETETFEDYEYVKEGIGPFLSGLCWKTELFESLEKLKTKVHEISAENKTHIIFDDHLKHLVIYGPRQNTDTTKQCLLQIIPPKQSYCFKEVSLRNPTYPKGTMKQIILNYGCDVERRLKESCKAEDVKILLKQHIIKIEGSEEAYDNLIQILNEIANLLGNRESKDTNELGECPICFDPIQGKDCFAFETCGHLYCRSCATQLIRINTDQAIIPMLCIMEGCNKPIPLSDVQMLISNQEFNKLQNVAIKVLQYQNPERYKFCVTPDCPTVFPTKTFHKLLGEDLRDNELRCSECGLSLCRVCGKKGHPGLPCASLSENETRELKTWQDTDPLNRSNCPRCRSGIEKNGGCSHVECLACKIHICWQCKETFDTSQKCYDHIGSFHPYTG